MIKEVKKQKEITEYYKYCDVCGARIIKGLACSKAKCEYCGKDLCEECIGYEEPESGDYRTVYCAKCWDIGKDYRPKIEQYEEEVWQLYKEWKDKCKNDTI
jgi:hypothetical protein